MSAQHHLSEALTLADAHGTVAWLWASRSDYGRAFEHAKAALPHYEKSGTKMPIAMADDDYGTANTLMNLGRTHLALGQSDQAAEVWQRALDLLAQQGREEEAGRLREQLQP
ncbi:hypothetical protein ACIRG5_03830 [Lentzea sp. NPDC102401]|uniref:hypothetical protein n=1 Tax=Lentzea sp. NPDC102401 TaxID=3364128 RepID=UPI00381BD6DD